MNEATRQVMHSSAKDDWRTPLAFFKWLCGKIAITADVDWSAPIIPGWPEGHSALDLWPELHGNIYCNPPYGRQLEQWLERGAEACRWYAISVVWLLPARTDTAWFHKYAKNNGVWFLKGRLTFEGAPAPAPFPSMLLHQTAWRSNGMRCVDWKAEIGG